MNAAVNTDSHRDWYCAHIQEWISTNGKLNMGFRHVKETC